MRDEDVGRRLHFDLSDGTPSTFIPGRTLWPPSATTLSPAASPFSTNCHSREMSPRAMYRRVASPPSPTTHTYGPRTSCSTAVAGIAGRISPFFDVSVTVTVPPGFSIRDSFLKSAYTMIVSVCSSPAFSTYSTSPGSGYSPPLASESPSTASSLIRWPLAPKRSR